MSHTTEVSKVKVTDIEALRTAVARMQREGVQCRLTEKKRPRMYFDNQAEVCDYVVELPNSKYDVGFRKAKDGNGYVPIVDTWGDNGHRTAGHVAHQLGAQANGAMCPLPTTEEGKAQHAVGRLMSAYSEEAMKKAARAQGYSVERAFTDKEGNVQLVLNTN